MTAADILKTLSAVQRQCVTLSSGMTSWIDLVKTERFTLDREGVRWIFDELGRLQAEIVCLRAALQPMLWEGN